MKITKYPQSNFLIEKNGKKLLIDLGNFTLEKYKIDELPTPNAILITHQHPDHMDKDALKTLGGKGIPVYGNSDVEEQLAKEGLEAIRVGDGKEFEAAGFNIKPIDIPHCKLLYCTAEKKTLKAPAISHDKKCKAHPYLKPETTDGPPNTGFIINGAFFHPGDSIDPQNFEVSSAAIPINGPTIEFENAWGLAGSLKAKKIIPMHYTHPTFIADPKKFAGEGKGNTEVIILENGQSTEIEAPIAKSPRILLV